LFGSFDFFEKLGGFGNFGYWIKFEVFLDCCCELGMDNGLV
jgi:hypothetical protein